MNNKGNLNSLFPAVLGIILVGSILCFGLIVVEGFGNVTYKSTTVSVANETLTSVDTVGELTAASVERNVACASAFCINASDDVVIPVTNYSLNANTCRVTMVNPTPKTGGKPFNGTDWKCSYAYTYDNHTAATDATKATVSSIATIGDTWLPIVIVVLAAGIVLGILLGAFGGAKRK